MKMLPFARALDIPDRYMDSLVQAEIQCWGSEPFGEFKICSNSECKRVFSIEDIYKYSSQLGNTCCSECFSETVYMYPSGDFKQEVSQYIQGNVSAILIISEENDVVGFAVIVKTTISDVLQNEFSTRPDSYNSDTCPQICQRIFAEKEAKNKDVICFQQIYVDPKIRTSQLSFQLLTELFLLKPEYSGIPVVLETKYDCNLYPITRSIGFSDIIGDKYGYIIQSIQNYCDVSHFLSEHNSYRTMAPSMRRYKDFAESVILKNPGFSGPRYYL